MNKTPMTKTWKNLGACLCIAAGASVSLPTAGLARPDQRIDYINASLTAFDQHGNPIKLDNTKPAEISTKALTQPLFKGVGEVIVNNHFEIHRANVVSVDSYIGVSVLHAHEFNGDKVYKKVIACLAYDSERKTCLNERPVYAFAVGTSESSKSHPGVDFVVYYDPMNAEQSFEIDTDIEALKVQNEIIQIGGANYEKYRGLGVLSHPAVGDAKWIPHCTGYKRAGQSSSVNDLMVLGCESQDYLEEGDSGGAIFQFGENKKKRLLGLIEGRYEEDIGHTGINIVLAKAFVSLVARLKEYTAACKAVPVLTGEVIDSPKGCVPETPQGLKTAQQGFSKLAAK